MISKLKTLTQSALAHSGFRRYFANTSWMLGEQILRIVSGLLVGIWVARYLGPEQFGIFSYALAFVSIFGAIAKLGLDGILVRDLVNNPQMRDVYLGTAFWLKIVGALLMLIMVAIATLFTTNDSTTNLYIFIIASGIIFQSFEVIDFYFQSQVLSKFVSTCKIIQLLLSSILKIYFVVTGADLFWFVLVTFIDQATLALTLFIAYKYQKFISYFRRFEFNIAKKLLKDSWPLILSGLAVALYMRIDQVMIKQMLGDKEVGLYSATIRISEAFYFIPVIITSSLFPAIVNAKKISKELYYFRLQSLYSVLVWFAITIAVFISCIGESLILLLYGPEYSGAGKLLTINIWTCIFVFFGSAWSKWMLTENRIKTSLIFQINAMIFNIILNTFLIPIYGVQGAAISSLIAASIGHTLLPIFIRSQRIALVMFLHSITAIFSIKWISNEKHN